MKKGIQRDHNTTIAEPTDKKQGGQKPQRQDVQRSGNTGAGSGNGGKKGSGGK